MQIVQRAHPRAGIVGPARVGQPLVSLLESGGRSTISSDSRFRPPVAPNETPGGEKRT